MDQRLLDSPIEYLKGVGPTKGDLLKKELSIFTFRDLLTHFPYRYIDKTQFHRIRELRPESGMVQIKGVLRRLSTVGEGRKRRLVGRLRDESGAIDLVWFTGIHWIEKSLVVGKEYVVFGRVNAFRQQLSIPHPEIEVVSAENTKKANTFAPVYNSTEKLNTKGLDAKGRRRLILALFEKLNPTVVPENLPAYMIKKLRFPSRFEALKNIHMPQS